MTETLDVWLVQRGRFKTLNESEVTGIDSLVSYDYMGSAEFEFGALGKSYRRILDARTEYGTKDSGLRAKSDLKHEHRLYVFAREEVIDEVIKIVEVIAAGKRRLKEPAYMDRALSGTDGYGGTHGVDTNVWWDIQNDWIAFLATKTKRGIVEYVFGKSKVR